MLHHIHAGVLIIEQAAPLVSTQGACVDLDVHRHRSPNTRLVMKDGILYIKNQLCS